MVDKALSFFDRLTHFRTFAMSLPTRQVLLGMVLGAVCAAALAAVGPGFAVDVLPANEPRAIDPADLVTFEGRDYDMQYEDWVATAPLTHSRVKKVEMGRVSYVDITTTATGTYSTDALFSNHIQYPGITVTDRTKPATVNRFSFWNGGSWTSFGTRGAQSFLTIRSNGTVIHRRGNQTCIGTGSFYSC